MASDEDSNAISNSAMGPEEAAGIMDLPIAAPITIRPKIAPQTAVILALPKATLSRSMLSRMTGRRAAGAKVEIQAAKKDDLHGVSFAQCCCSVPAFAGCDVPPLGLHPRKEIGTAV